jgi:hypothetical protein
MRHVLRQFPVLSLALVGFALAPPAHGVNFCVGTTAELRSALQTAASNGTDDQIRVKTGTYRGDGAGPVASVATSEDGALTLRGGYVDVAGFECASLSSDPTATNIDGEDVRAGLRLAALPGSSAAITVQNLTLTRGSTAEFGAGLDVGGVSGYTGNVLIERVIFVDNVASFGGALNGYTAGTFTLRNSVFRGNVATDNGAASVVASHPGTAAYRIFIGGNTFVTNACTDDDPPCNAGVRIGLSGNARAAVFNNAFVLSDGTDLSFNGNGLADLLSNNLQAFTGTPGVQSGNLMLTEPGFVDLLGGNFRLRFTSPLREAGNGAFDLGALDAAGRPRLSDERYDIGAFENDEILFSDSFESVP